MITHFDFTTGGVEANDEQSAPLSQDGYQTLEARLLTRAEAAAQDRPETAGMPADLAGVPVERFLARFCR